MIFSPFMKESYFFLRLGTPFLTVFGIYNNIAALTLQILSNYLDDLDIISTILLITLKVCIFFISLIQNHDEVMQFIRVATVRVLLKAKCMAFFSIFNLLFQVF